MTRPAARLAAVVLALAAAAGCGGGDGDAAGSGTTTAAPDGPRRIEVGEDPFGVAAAGGAVWVGLHDGGTVVRVDAASGRVLGRTEIGGTITGMAADAGGAWAVRWQEDVVRLDGEGRQAGRWAGAANPDYAALAGGRLWVSDYGRNSASWTDVALEADGRVRVGPPLAAGAEGAGGIGAGGGDVYVLRTDTGTVWRVTSPDAEPEPIEVGGKPVAAVAAEGSLWVADFTADEVAQVDPASGEVVRRIAVEPRPGALAASPGSVWVASSGSDRVTRIDARAGEVAGTVKVGAAPSGLAVAAGALWVACRFDRAVWRVPLDAG